ncbi:MAG: GNAT family N-acetyltransferase [Armatimonadetes bacterium]|nr:GNAT family N-acetyltransferase [Armatimonadota bacterium]
MIKHSPALIFASMESRRGYWHPDRPMDNPNNPGSESQPVRVRRMRREDWPEAARILAVAFADKFGPIFGRSSERAIMIMLETGHMRTTEAYLAEIDGHPAGVVLGKPPSSVHPPDMLLLWRFQAAFGFQGTLRALAGLSLLPSASPGRNVYEVEVLATNPAYRRRGVGRALLQACEAAARSISIRTLGLTVIEGNEAAIALYRSYGFVRRKRVWMGYARPFFGFSAVWTMVKKIPPSS